MIWSQSHHHQIAKDHSLIFACERGCFSVEVCKKNFCLFDWCTPTYTFTIHHNMSVDHCNGSNSKVLHISCLAYKMACPYTWSQLVKLKLGTWHDKSGKRFSSNCCKQKKNADRFTETGINQHFLNMHLTYDLLAVALTKLNMLTPTLRGFSMLFIDAVFLKYRLLHLHRNRNTVDFHTSLRSAVILTS